MKVSKLLLRIIVISIFSANLAFAEDVFVKIRPTYKIRAYSFVKQPGDDIVMKVSQDVQKNGSLYIKKGTPVYGILTEITNTRSDEMGSIAVNYFKTTDVNGKKVKLVGSAVKKCKDYSNWQCFIIFGNPVMTKKDEYTLKVRD